MFFYYLLLSLKVRNGPDASSPLLGTRLCGSSPPSLLQTTDNHLFVHFVSDASNEGNGFRLTFEAHSQGTSMFSIHERDHERSHFQSSFCVFQTYDLFPL